MFHRTILTKLNASFYEFISTSKYFLQGEAEPPSDTDEEEAYFEEIEMSSYLRAFKELSAIDTFYQLLHVHILNK